MNRHLLAAILLVGAVSITSGAAVAGGDIPVILDTDIGFDIDDTWALGMLVKQPEFDVKLVLGTHGKHLYRARLIAKFLDTVERSDIPVGVGPNQGRGSSGRQSGWLGDYQLARYPGEVHQDGIQAMIDIIMASDETVTIIAIGPMTNLAKALQRQPAIANKARVIAVMGSIRKGMFNRPDAAREYNAAVDVLASQQVLSAPWPVIIAPWDTTGAIQLKGDDYERVFESGHIVAETIIENYRAWLPPPQQLLVEQESTILFDTLAVYLATLPIDRPDDELVQVENLRIRVAGNGMTVIDPAAREIQAATRWNDQREFHRYVRDSVAKKQGFFSSWLKRRFARSAGG